MSTKKRETEEMRNARENPTIMRVPFSEIAGSMYCAMPRAADSLGYIEYRVGYTSLPRKEWTPGERYIQRCYKAIGDRIVTE